MTAFRIFSLPTHSVLEMVAGLVLLAAPFALGFGAAATVISVALGALIVGLGIGAMDDISVAAHYAFDHALVGALLVGSLALGLDGDGPAALTLFCVGVSQFALLVTTRYSRPAASRA